VGRQQQQLAQASRREFLATLAAVGVALSVTVPRQLRADCTIADRNPIQGPYYLGDPEEKYDTGSSLIVKGTVKDAQTCVPLTGAIIVRWHANQYGTYEEYYRATMVTDKTGAFQMSTIQPGSYASLQRHIHWYVVAPGYKPVIAQIQWADNTTIPGTETFDFSLAKAM
jgi:protocatechuate 3,4-dioxygenase beta subunit